MATESLGALDLVDAAPTDPDRSAAEALARYGGKARNLGLLIRRGFDVPEGFCVDTAAFQTVVDGISLTGEPAQIRTRISTAPIPDSLRIDIEGCYRQLGNDAPVAVRSSATAEDLDEASFAGQQDTLLHVVGVDAVLDAVRRCWASAWTDRAVGYRQDREIDDAAVSVAVVVQRMVDAEVAGVMFTADPLTGSRGRTVIEANPGLGESVVSGSVDPDHWAVEAKTGSILEERVGAKQSRVTGLAGGGTRVERLTDQGPCLTHEEIAELARLGAGVERAFGGPQDIEWALDGERRIWFTQTRSITTLFPLLDGPDAEFGVYVCLSLAQGLVRPITPMGRCQMTLMGSCVAALAGRPFARVDRVAGGPKGLRFAAGRPFVDITRTLQNPVSRKLALAASSIMEARLVPVIERLVDDPSSPLHHRARRGRVRSLLRVVTTMAPILIKTRVPLQVITAAASPRLAYRRLDRVKRNLWGMRLAVDTPPQRRLDLVEEFLSTRAVLLMPGNIGYAAAGFGFLALARSLLGDVGRGQLQPILRALPHNVTTEMDLDLWALSREVAQDPASVAVFGEVRDPAVLSERWRGGSLPPIAQRGLTRFLDRHGYRGVAEIDLGMPRWSEDPSHVLGLINGYLQLDDEHDAAQHFRSGADEAEDRLEHLCRQLARRSTRSAIGARVARFALRRARALIGLRESPKSLLVLCFARMRRELLAVADELVGAGVLSVATDISMITIDDARRGLRGEDLRRLVQANRAEYDRELQRRHIPRLLLTDGTEPEALGSGAGAEADLRGSPASGGVVTARARVLLDPDGARLGQGEILVAPSTDPGWTPLFLIAGGLIMEMGGSNSHGAVVAREYGIPAVVGVRDATTRIRTGDVITLDGASGTVVQGGPSSHN